MRIVIVGLPFFGKRLADNLSRFDSENNYVFLDTYSNRWDKIKALFLVPKADVIFSINGTLNKSRIFDYALKKEIPVIMNWVGTDVQLAIASVQNSTARLDYIQKAHHFCEVSWIQEELLTIGISSKIQNFASFPSNFELKPFLTNQLNVFCYINDQAPIFYGINELIKLAQHFPQIQFEVVGTNAESFRPLPKNIHTHGWVKDMDEHFNKCQVSLRFPSHDGLATFVLESLARGKHVLYKYNYQNCIHTPSYDDMVEALKSLLQQFNAGKLEPNIEGAQFIKTSFSNEVIFGSLISYFKTISKHR